MSNPVWSVDGNALPRNPDSWDVKWDKANVSYEPQASGAQIRVAAPYSITGADFVLTWMNADRRTLNRIMQYLNPVHFNVVHKITIDGIQPPMQAYAYFDTPQKTMSKDILSKRPGEGGTRQDLTLTLRMTDAAWRSLNVVPKAHQTAAQIAQWFGGLAGNGTDGIPVWDGTDWSFDASSGTVTENVNNLGTAPWFPVIRINGPFSAATLTETYFDVDGTNAGAAFTWTGPSVNSGDYVMFDTYWKRCYLVVSGALNEVYTFKVFAVSSNLPFSYWPPLNPGNNNPVSLALTGASVGATLDFSNNSQEVFRYW